MYDQDEAYMTLALNQARKAEQSGEVPIGAVLVSHSEIIAQAYNSPIARHDPTAHAEILALRKGGEVQKNYRLPDTTLYVTLEPCVMCLGAMVHARLKRLVFGAYDEKSGAVETRCQWMNHPVFNHRMTYTGGVLSESCGQLLKQFFEAKR